MSRAERHISLFGNVLYLKDVKRPLLRCFALGLMLCGAVMTSGCLPSGRMQVQNSAVEVADTTLFPQSLAFFAQKAGGLKVLRSDDDAAKDMVEFRRQFFSPWTKTSADAESLRYFADILSWQGERRGFAENMRPWSDAEWEAMVRNAALCLKAPNAVGSPASAASPAPQAESSSLQTSAPAPLEQTSSASPSETDLAVVTVTTEQRETAAPATLGSEHLHLDGLPDQLQTSSSSLAPSTVATSAEALRAGITVRAADLRNAPTMRPRFSRLEGAGQGWPFDEFQQSAVSVGVPVMVHHVSLDGAWMLVETAGVWGWILADAVALVDKPFMEYWQSAPLGAFVQDGISLRAGAASSQDALGAAFIATANIGTVLPMPSSGHVLTPLRGLDGTASALTVRLGKDSPSVVAMPLRLTPHAVALIGDRMMGQPYGWGGMYGRRDCSAMMRDMFSAFGIWLPRNSGEQVRRGEQVALEGVGALAKEALILEKAEPFRSLLWMPGHIGLYIGEHEGQAAWFHNMWGLRSTLKDGSEGRAILGRAVVTSLRPGQERADMKPETLLIERLSAISTLKK